MTDFPFPPVLPTDPQEREELLRRFAEHENIPQEARALFVAKPWQLINRFQPDELAIGSSGAARMLIEGGVDAEQLSAAMRYAAYSAVFDVLMLLDEGRDHDAPPDSPGWQLIETVPDEDGEPVLTGRHVAGLHESILSADPSGMDGAHFLW